MDHIETRKDDAKPLYLQVADEIARLIQTGKIQKGSSIGGQHELVQRYKVSRVTLRHAIKILEERGLVVTRQGKGTYVVSSSVSQELGSLLSLGEIVEAQGLRHVVQVADFRWVLPPESVGSFFGQPEESPVLRIKRLHTVNDQPIALAIIYVPIEVGLALTVEDMNRYPLYTIMEDRLGIRLGRAVQQITAAGANEEVASFLQVETGYPLLVAERLTCSDSGKPVEHITFYYRADCYRFTVTLQRARAMSLVVPPFPGQVAAAVAVEGGEQGQVAASLELAKDPGRSKL